MSAPFKFKLKVKREDGGAPSNSQQPSQQQQPGYGGLNAQHPSAGLSGAPSSQQWNNGQQQASGLQSSAPSGKIRLKVKMGTGSHPAAPQQQHWDAPHVPPPPPPVRLKREPQDWEHGGRPPAAATSGAAPAGAGAGPPPVKKIKLSMGKPKLAVAAGGGEAAAGGGFGGGGLPPPLPKKKPIIKFKPPPKQPRDAAAAAAVGAAAAADGGLGGPEPSLLPRTSTLPIVRLTLPVVAGGGGLPAGAPRRLKNIKLKAARPLGRQGGGGGPSGLGPRAKKLKPRRAAATSPDGFGLGGGAPQRRPKRSKSDLKELRCDAVLLLRSGCCRAFLQCSWERGLESSRQHLLPARLPAPTSSIPSPACAADVTRVPHCILRCRDLGIDDFDLDEYDPDEPIAPRTFTLRSTHAGKAATQAPSSTGLGLSTGGPAPSDARTGGGGAAAVDTAGTEVCIALRWLRAGACLPGAWVLVPVWGGCCAHVTAAEPTGTCSCTTHRPPHPPTGTHTVHTTPTPHTNRPLQTRCTPSVPQAQGRGGASCPQCQRWPRGRPLGRRLSACWCAARRRTCTTCSRSQSQSRL